MPDTIDSSLSNKRILISLIIAVGIPVISFLLNLWIHQEDIALMTAMNVGACILMIYDWNLFGIHYNRSKKDLRTACLYMLVGIVLFFLLTWFNNTLLHARRILPSRQSLKAYGYARPGMLLAYSFVQSFVLSIIYKCITDRIQVAGKELQTILLSSFVFGFLYLIAFVPFHLSVWICTYVYNVILTAILSYLYNQSHSLLPGILALGIVYLLSMCI